MEDVVVERYNLSVPRKGKDDKTFWDNIGVMFKRDKGGYTIRLAMFPELNIMAFPAEEKGEKHANDDKPPF